MGILTESSSGQPVQSNGKPPKLAIKRDKKIRLLGGFSLAFEVGVEIARIVIA